MVQLVSGGNRKSKTATTLYAGGKYIEKARLYHTIMHFAFAG